MCVCVCMFPAYLGSEKFLFSTEMMNIQFYLVLVFPYGLIKTEQEVLIKCSDKINFLIHLSGT